MSSINQRKVTTNETINASSPSSSAAPLAPYSTFVQVGVAASMGLGFGIFINKSRVFEPTIIQEQFGMRVFLMMKVFLSAAASSKLMFIVLTHAAPRHMQIAVDNFFVCLRDKGALAVGVGGSLLGAGMALAGTCPGIVLVQFGSGVVSARYTLAGIGCGTLLYAILEPVIRPLIRPSAPPASRTLHAKFGVSYTTLSAVFIAAMGAFVYFLESTFPWRNDISAVTGGATPLHYFAWMPEVAGLLIGALQVPCVIFLGDTLGSTSSYVTALSFLSKIPLVGSALPYFKGYFTGMGNWWQVIYLTSAIAGAYLSTSLAPVTQELVGPAPQQAFVGGILLQLGSRLASGCTSGHGLSGMGLLSSLSILGVASMFAGGMFVSFLQYGRLFY